MKKFNLFLVSCFLATSMFFITGCEGKDEVSYKESDLIGTWVLVRDHWSGGGQDRVYDVTDNYAPTIFQENGTVYWLGRTELDYNQPIYNYKPHRWNLDKDILNIIDPLDNKEQKWQILTLNSTTLVIKWGDTLTLEKL